MKKNRSVKRVRSGMYQERGELNDPNLSGLKEDFEWSVTQRDRGAYRRERLNWDARNAYWPGQSADGRKWNPQGGEDQVFPWPGSSDTRVRP